MPGPVAPQQSEAGGGHDGADDEPPNHGRWRGPPVAVGFLAVFVAMVGGIVWLSSGSDSPRGGSPTSTTAATSVIDDDGFLGTPGAANTVTVEAAEPGVVEVRWEPGDPDRTDRYRLSRTDPGHAGDPFVDVAAPTVSYRYEGLAEAERPCVVVVAIGGGRPSEPTAPVCAAP